MSRWQASGDKRLGIEREQAGRALRLWRDFPTTLPRRLVLTGHPVLALGGFTSGGMKLAYLRRAWQLPTSAPTEILKVARASAGTTRGSPDAVLPVQVVTRSATSFDTDRGALELSAWRLDSSQSIGPIWVLAEEIFERVWAPGETIGGSRQLQHAQVIDAVSAYLNVTFTGGHPRWVDYPLAEVIETERAIAVLPVAHDTGPLGARTLEGHLREVVAELRAPIGDRVLINLDGSPVAVLGTD